MNLNKLILFMLLSSSLIVAGTSSPKAASAATDVLSINSVNWAADVEPGDIGADLIVSITNLSNLTLGGITGTLVMNHPFSDSVDGDTNATAQGIASSTYINVSEYKVFGGEPFTFQFTLNINPDAVTGLYTTDLEVSYLFLNSTGEWERQTRVLLLDLIIPNREPVIIASYPTAPFVTVNLNETLDFNVTAIDPDNQLLTYQWMFDNLNISTDTNYTLTASESNLGVHTLEVMVRDPLDRTAINTWTVNVARESVTALNMESQYIHAGYKSILSFNLSNTVWKGTADIEASVPDGIIITGASNWKLTGLTPGDEVSLNTTVYVPLQFLGQTGGFSLTIDYTDYLGNDVTENLIQGVIIRGRVDIIVYDLVSQYDSKSKKLTFNANLLNRGTVSARFVNVSLHDDPDLLLTLGSASYIGELEENDPLPVTLTTFLSKNPANNETITVDAVISWFDDLQEEFFQNITFSLVIVSPTTSTRTVSNSGFDLIIGGGFTLAVLAFAIIGVIYFRQKKIGV